VNRQVLLSAHRAGLAGLMLAALAAAGCGPVSDMLGLSKKKAVPAAAPVEKSDPAAQGDAAGAVTAAGGNEATGRAGSRTLRAPRGLRAAVPAKGSPDTAPNAMSAVTIGEDGTVFVHDPNGVPALESRTAAMPGGVGAPVISAPRPLIDGRIYSKTDPDVVPARLVSAQRGGPMFRNMESAVNTMELIISKQARVEEFRLISPPQRMTDMLLLSGAKTWKFVPALKDGQPVRYRTQFSWDATP
jgi:hypothetical protein